MSRKNRVIAALAVTALCTVVPGIVGGALVLISSVALVWLTMDWILLR